MDNIAIQIGQTINDIFSAMGAYSLRTNRLTLGYIVIFVIVLMVLGTIGEIVGNKKKEE